MIAISAMTNDSKLQPPKVRPTILMLVEPYLAGCSASGPTQSLANLVACLGKDYDFLIATSDRDPGSSQPYKGITFGEWTAVGQAKVLYLPQGYRGLWLLAKCIVTNRYDVLCLNGVFNRRYTMLALWLRRFGLLEGKSVILAPRGEFSKGALMLKGLRKRLYLGLAKRIGLFKNITWHASTELEAKDFHRVLGVLKNTRVAAPLSAEIGGVGTTATFSVEITAHGGIENEAESYDAPPKIAGKLDVVFISRICIMKNLDYALRALSGLKGEVSFHIFGPTEDVTHWEQCEKLIAALPSGVSAAYCGVISHEKVMRVISAHHLLLLPTRGENYGHVIVEAFLAGRPVLISDRTPWRDLERYKAGWDVPLEKPDRFREVLQRCVDMGMSEYNGLCEGVQRYVAAHLNMDSIIRANRVLLDSAVTQISRREPE